MREVVEISAENLYKAVYQACFSANVYLPQVVYNSINELGRQNIEDKLKISKINANALIAAENKRPLCQDTGQVIAFVKIGENVLLDKGTPLSVISKAVEDCYKENFFRKSVVKDAIFDRSNTGNNLPAIVYTEYGDDDEIKVDLLIKGGGAENMSATKMFNPSASESEIMDFIAEIVKKSGQNACPPLFLGVGIGGTIDYASVLSKKAFFVEREQEFSKKLKQFINEVSPVKIAWAGVLSAPTHIASLPLCVTLNCHSCRHASMVVKKNDFEILTKFVKPKQVDFYDSDIKEVNVEDISSFKGLKQGEDILLSGTIYTARDAAHQRLIQLIKNGEKLPFEIKNAVIFYAGPCPKNENEIIGPIGPTTSKRMDKFACTLYDMGLLATIGKGLRAKEVCECIAKNNAFYFTAQGGVASLLQKCVKEAQIVAFEDLGAEAIYKLKVEKLPLKVEWK